MTYSSNRERLRILIENRCFSFGTYILSNGDVSSYYFDCKAATLDGECASLITEEVMAEIDQLPSMPTAIGGLTMGADFIVSGVITRAHQIGHPTAQGSIVRKEPKKHGTRHKIENQLDRGTKIVVVDDVITTGASIEEACDAFLDQGYEIVGIIAIIDRMAGGKERLERNYGIVHCLFNREDFPLIEQKSGQNGKAAIAQ